MCVLLATILLVTSCMKSNDDNSILYGDTAISSFTLGTLNGYLHTTSSTGADSVYQVSVTGSDYKFNIDQINHRIFNVDSLPMGTDVQHVICYASSLNNGLIVIKNEKNDSLSYYSSSDSIDFTNPREFRVYASDGSGYQSYTVEVNVHQEEGNLFSWTAHPNSNEMVGLDAMKAVMIGSHLYIYGAKSGKTIGYMTSDGDTWSQLVEVDDEEAYKNLVVYNDVIYMIANGALQKTTDGNSWTEIKSDVEVKQLVAASKTELYALSSDSRMMVSRDEGLTWTEDNLDEDASWLPQEEIAYVSVPMNMTINADYILLAGVSPAIPSIDAVWRKIVEYDLQGEGDKWAYMERTDDNLLGLPQLHHLVMLPYDDGILAFGESGGMFSALYQSRDNGITWKKNSRYELPEQFSGDVNSFAAATDGKEIWLVSGTGEVWQGHLNRLVWNKKE